MDGKGAQEAEVPGPPAQPMRALRPTAGFLEEVQVVPGLLPQPGARGDVAGSDQGKLVKVDNRGPGQTTIQTGGDEDEYDRSSRGPVGAYP